MRNGKFGPRGGHARCPNSRCPYSRPCWTLLHQAYSTPSHVRRAILYLVPPFHELKGRRGVRFEGGEVVTRSHKKYGHRHKYPSLSFAPHGLYQAYFPSRRDEIGQTVVDRAVRHKPIRGKDGPAYLPRPSRGATPLRPFISAVVFSERPDRNCRKALRLKLVTSVG